MPTVINIPKATFPNGTHSYGPAQITGNVSLLTIRWDASKQTKKTHTIRFALEVSIDGGATWFPGGKIDFQGNYIDKATGQQLVEGVARFLWCWPLANPMLRGTMQVGGGALQTSCSIAWEENPIAAYDAHHSVAYVQKVFAAGTGASVTTGAINTTAGNLLVATTGDYGNARTPAVSDNNTETWANSLAAVGHGGGTVRVEYAKNCKGKSGHTFTCTTNGGYPTIAVTEVSGADTSAPLGQAASVDIEASQPAVAPTITTGTDGEWIESGIIVSATPDGTPSLNAGSYTALQLQPDGSVVGMGLAYQIGGAAGSHSGASYNSAAKWAATIAFTTSYKAAASVPLLVVQDSACLVESENVALTQHQVLVVANSECIVPSESPTLTQHQVLTVADSQCLVESESPALTQHQTLAVADSECIVESEQIVLVQHQALTVQDSECIVESGNVVLAQHQALVVADSACLVESDNVVLVQHQVLTVADSECVVTSESPTLATTAAAGSAVLFQQQLLLAV